MKDVVGPTQSDSKTCDAASSGVLPVARQVERSIEQILENTMRLADTGTRMEAIRLRDMILDDLAKVKSAVSSSGSAVYAGNIEGAYLRGAVANAPAIKQNGG